MNRREVMHGVASTVALAPAGSLLLGTPARAGVPPVKIPGWDPSSFGDKYFHLPAGRFARPTASLSAFPLGFNPFTVGLRFRLNSLAPQTLWSCDTQTLDVTATGGQPGGLLFQGAQPLGSKVLEIGRWYTAHCVAGNQAGTEAYWQLFVDGELWGQTWSTVGDWPEGPPPPTYMPQRPLLIGQSKLGGTTPFVTDVGLDVADLRIWRKAFDRDDALLDIESFDPQSRTLYVRVDLSRDVPAVTRNVEKAGSSSPAFTLDNAPPVKLRAPYTLFQLARRIAPRVRLHSRDPYRPSSVDWYVRRCDVVSGHATMRLFDLQMQGCADLSSLPVIASGANLDWSKLPVSNRWGGGNDDDIGFIPAWGSERKHGRFFSDYQLETLHGEPIVDNKCTAEAYVHITVEGGLINFTYYFFYPYNGGMGPTTTWDAGPLGDRAGFYAHFGDWERVTASVTVNSDKTVNLIRYLYEWHGNVKEVKMPPGPPFANRSFEELIPTPVYSCWHSHASWPNAGEHPTETSVATDYADDGPVWNTGDRLVQITTTSHPWVAYNGTFGANLTTYDTSLAGVWTGPPVQKIGPEGPAFKPSFINLGEEW